MKNTLSKPKICLRDTIYTYQNLLMIIGLVFSFSGGSWDITFHILSQPESFFSYPHLLVYSGILLMIAPFFINIKRNLKAEKTIKKNNNIILTGIIFILAAGPFDFSWHLRFGLDGLLSPPHLTLLTGWLLIAIGNLRITNLKLSLWLDENNNLNSDANEHVYDKINESFLNKTLDNKSKSGFVIKKGKKKIGNILLIQLFLNLSILLMILSGLLYFFSLPFSETQSYNFNPPSNLAFFIYGLGFPILFSAYFLKILSKYPNFAIMVPLVAFFYVMITMFTQILSNPFLHELWGYYMLNLIPFGVFYMINKKFEDRPLYNKKNKKRIQDNGLATSMLSTVNLKMVILGIGFAILSYSLCFPLNTYIYNEELYGYLIYQNLVLKVYLMVFSDNFMIILPISVVGGIIGYIISTSKRRSLLFPTANR